MKIDAVDFFYLAMPEIEDIADGSQDALVVRVRAGDHVGWGECEAAPLVSIASWCCPPSHSVCRPLHESVIGQTIDSVSDIERIHRLVHTRSLDLLQADHTLSGIDMALWDLLGRRLKTPVYRLLGYKRAYPKIAYASLLFGDDPQTTLERGREVRARGFRAAKFGWGPFGHGTVEADAAQTHAAREGLGEEATLLIDAGTVWRNDVEAARARLPALEECNVTWLEEPFVTGAFQAYRELSRQSDRVGIASGEGCHNVELAVNMLENASLQFIQIDAGRIGGITAGKQVADEAARRGVTFVNHTFTTQLALSASLQPFAGLENHRLCEYPAAPTSLGRDLTTTRLTPNSAGELKLSNGPGLGVEPDLEVIRKYLRDIEISADGKVLYSTPSVYG